MSLRMITRLASINDVTLVCQNDRTLLLINTWTCTTNQQLCQSLCSLTPEGIFFNELQFIDVHWDLHLLNHSGSMKPKNIPHLIKTRWTNRFGIHG